MAVFYVKKYSKIKQETKLSLTTRAMLAVVSHGFCINSAVQSGIYTVIIIILSTAKLT